MWWISWARRSACDGPLGTYIGVALLASSPISSTSAHIHSTPPSLLASLSSSVGNPFKSVNTIVVPPFWIVCSWSNTTEYPCFRRLLVDSSGLFTSNTLNLTLNGMSAPFTSRPALDNSGAVVLEHDLCSLLTRCEIVPLSAQTVLRNRADSSDQKHLESTTSFAVLENDRIHGFRSDVALMCKVNCALLFWR